MESHYSLAHRSDIQGLRAIAILLVVLGHAHVPGFAGGFVGVDVFFVLSGFLITGILFREYRQSGKIVYTAFLARRLKRLLPALLVMLGVTELVAPGIMTGYEFAQQSASAPYAATWTSNFFFTFSQKNYFSVLQAHDLYLHTWSLGVEEQFYILWPALIFVLLELSTSGKDSFFLRKRFLLGLGIFFSISFGISQYWSAVHPTWSFYLMPSRIWQFALGASVFIWSESKHFENSFLKNKQKVILIAGLVLIIASAVTLNKNMTYPGYWATIPSVGAAMVIIAGSLRQGAGNEGILSHPALVWIGDRSYSWYLWHWPVLALGFSWFELPGALVIAGLLAVSMILAMISYRAVELPFWKGRFSSMPAFRTISASALVILIAIVVLPTSVQTLQLDRVAADSSASMPVRLDVPVIYSLQCDTWVFSAEVKPCVLSSPKAKKTVVLFADSIGAQWYSMLPAIYRKPEWRIIVLTKSSCPIVDEDYFYARIQAVNTVCRHWRNASLDYLESIHPDVLYIGSDTTYGFSENKWINGSQRILDRLSRVSGKIIILPGTDSLNFDGPSCLEKKKRCRRKLPAHTKVEKVTRFLGEVAKKYSNVSLLNLNDLVCPGGYCSARDSKGLIVYRDDKHLTDTFVRALAPTISQRLKKLGLAPTNLN